MRDVLLAVVALAAALAYKVVNQQLTWELTIRNLLEAQFPIIAAAVVFFIAHVIKTSRSLIKEVRAEAGEVEYDPYPSLVLSEKIRATIKNEPPPYFLLKVLSFAATSIICLSALGVLSWKLNTMVSAFSPQPSVDNTNVLPTPAPIPPPSTPATSTPISTPAPSPSPPKLRSKRPKESEFQRRQRLLQELEGRNS
ncbi:MAG TPA: hypothetical protein VGB98_17710 [Pyrinomonadaceae bacterium]